MFCYMHRDVVLYLTWRYVESVSIEMLFDLMYSSNGAYGFCCDAMFNLMRRSFVSVKIIWFSFFYFLFRQKFISCHVRDSRRVRSIIFWIYHNYHYRYHHTTSTITNSIITSLTTSRRMVSLNLIIEFGWFKMERSRSSHSEMLYSWGTNSFHRTLFSTTTYLIDIKRVQKKSTWTDFELIM